MPGSGIEYRTGTARTFHAFNPAFFEEPPAPPPFPPELFKRRVPPVLHEVAGPFVFLASILPFFPPPEPFPDPLLKRKPAIAEVIEIPASAFRAPVFTLFEIAAPPFPPELLKRPPRIAEAEIAPPSVFRSLSVLIPEAPAPPAFPSELLGARRGVAIPSIDFAAPEVFRAPSVLFPPPTVVPFPLELLRSIVRSVESDVGRSLPVFVPGIGALLAPAPTLVLLKSATIRGLALGTANIIPFEVWARRTGGAGNFGLQVRYGGTILFTLSQIADPLQSLRGFIFAEGSAVAQRAYGKRGAALVTGTAVVDSTVDQLLEVYVDKATGGDLFTADLWLVERARPIPP